MPRLELARLWTPLVRRSFRAPDGGPPVSKLLDFLRDRLGASSADYVIILAGLCLALVIAGLCLDSDTQVKLQAQVMGLLGRG